MTPHLPLAMDQFVCISLHNTTSWNSTCIPTSLSFLVETFLKRKAILAVHSEWARWKDLLEAVHAWWGMPTGRWPGFVNRLFCWGLSNISVCTFPLSPTPRYLFLQKRNFQTPSLGVSLELTRRKAGSSHICYADISILSHAWCLTVKASLSNFARQYTSLLWWNWRNNFQM